MCMRVCLVLCVFVCVYSLDNKTKCAKAEIFQKNILTCGVPISFEPSLENISLKKLSKNLSNGPNGSNLRLSELNI